MVQETALLAGLEPSPANAERIARIEPRPELAMTRFRQRATALNYAIQSTPPPESAAERQALQRLNLDLSRLYLSANFVDLARDRLRAVIEGTRPADMQPEARAQMRRSSAASTTRSDACRSASTSSPPSRPGRSSAPGSR